MSLLKKIFGSKVKQNLSELEVKKDIKNPPMPSNGVSFELCIVQSGHPTVYKIHYPSLENVEKAVYWELHDINLKFLDGSHNYVDEALKNLRKVGVHLSQKRGYSQGYVYNVDKSDAEKKLDEIKFLSYVDNYYENGHQKEHLGYNGGKLDRVCEYYSEQGEYLGDAVYRNGVLIDDYKKRIVAFAADHNESDSSYLKIGMDIK